MPRITNLTFTKDYESVADGLASILENAVISAEYEYAGKPAIDVEGDFETLDLEEMDVWRGHIKFTVQDNRTADEDERQCKALVADAIPELAHALFSPCIAKAYRRIEFTIRTTTITERIENGEWKTHDEKVEESEAQYEWEDVTLELGKIMDERIKKW